MALEGFTHLIPFAADTRSSARARGPHAGPDDPGRGLRPADRCGLAERLIFSWGGNPGRRFAPPLPGRGRERLARPLDLEEHSHAGMANRYGPGRRVCRSPCSGGTTAATWAGWPRDRHRRLPVHRRGAGRRRRPQPGRHGHPCAAGRQGGQCPAVGHDGDSEGGGAGRPALLVTVEEVVDALEPRPGGVVLPAGW